MDSIALPKIPFSFISQQPPLNPSSPRRLKPLQPKPSPFSLRSSPRRLASFARFAAALSGSSGGGGSDGTSGGGGGGGDGGREAETKSIVVGELDELSDLGSDDVIILSVGGMSCGGCAASVKRILESQPQVSLANVIFEKAVAVISVVPEVKVTQDWQQELGEKLANHLTTCGFKSELRGGA